MSQPKFIDVASLDFNDLAKKLMLVSPKIKERQRIFEESQRKLGELLRKQITI